MHSLVFSMIYSIRARSTGAGDGLLRALRRRREAAPDALESGDIWMLPGSLHQTVSLGFRAHRLRLSASGGIL